LPDITPYDLNGDAAVDDRDLKILVNAILKAAPCQGCDLNSDDLIDVVDLQILTNVVLGMRSSP
jgi:hypothetical protein